MNEQELGAVKQELAAVKAEMERRVDQLHSQLHYWQNVTVNILKDHYATLNPGKEHKTLQTNSTGFLGSDIQSLGPASDCVKVEAADLESVVLNFTQSSKFK